MKRNTLFANETGSAMVVTLLALSMLTVLGTLMMTKTQTETQIAGNDMRATQAFFNAEAGYAEAMARLNDPSDTTLTHPITGSDPGWGVYVVLNTGDSALDPQYNVTLTDGLDNDLDGAVDESGEHYPEVLSSQGVDAIDYPFVKIQYKLNAANQVVFFGDVDNDPLTDPQQNLTKGLPVLVMTSVGQQGNANRTVRVEAVKEPLITNVAAVYLETDDIQFSGSAFLSSGLDWDPVTGAPIFSGDELTGITTTGDPNNITSGLSVNQENNIEGDGMEPSVTQATIDYDIQAMRDEFVTMAEITIPAGTYTGENWGDFDNYTVVHCTGDLKTSGTMVGGGILIVDGDFAAGGEFTWYGLIIVLGDIDFVGGGSGIHVFGSMFVTGGGNGSKMAGTSDITYSSAAIYRLANFNPFKIVSWREL